MFQSEIKSEIGEDISILIKLDNHPWNYLCECGDARALSVKEVQNSNAVFISHTHIDHFVNFDAVIRHQIGIQRRVVICGPYGIAKQVQSKILSYTWNLISAGAIIYEIREMRAENEIVIFEIEPPVWDLKEIKTVNNNVLFTEKNFEVTGVLLNHKTPAMAYKFSENNTVKINIQSSGFKGGKWVKELKTAFENQTTDLMIEIEDKAYAAKDLFHLLHVQTGDTVGVIMDHAASPENHAKIKAHFEGCRKVMIECFYKDEDKENAIANFHSYASMSGKVMKDSNVLEPVPVHFSRKYKQEDIETLVAEFNANLK
jgi:ribonuclease Z